MIGKSSAMNNRLVVRADADSQMGTGHVMRCIALGQAWQDAGGEVVFITCFDNAALLQRLRDENFTVVELSHPGEFIPLLLSDLRPLAPDLWSVLDGYRFDLDCQRAVRAAGFKLLLIDDYNHLPEYECDILLNQNINAPDLNYCVNPDAKLLLGTQYALLRREFQGRKAFQPVQAERNQNILVTLGGADPDNVTLKVIQALQRINLPDLHAKIIVGPANPHRASLETAIRHSTYNIQLINSARNMAELMNWADLAVSASGSTCWELCCLGVPFVTLVLAENQAGLADRLEKSGASRNMGWHYKKDVVGFSEAIHALIRDAGLRSRLARRAQEVVDGRGAFRVVATIKNESRETI